MVRLAVIAPGLALAARERARSNMPRLWVLLASSVVVVLVLFVAGFIACLMATLPPHETWMGMLPVVIA